VRKVKPGQSCLLSVRLKLATVETQCYLQVLLRQVMRVTYQLKQDLAQLMAELEAVFALLGVQAVLAGL
jgi:hypothetical protein